MVKDCLAQRFQVKPLQDRLRVSAGSCFVYDSPPEEIEQWKSERGCPALEILRPARQVKDAETFGPTAPLRHHVNEDIDVDENLQSVNLRAMISRIRALSSLTGFSGWIPTRARRSGSMGTLGHCFDNASRSVSPCRCIVSSLSFCSRSECSCRSSARKVAISWSRTSLSSSSICFGVFAMIANIIDDAVSNGQANERKTLAIKREEGSSAEG